MDYWENVCVKETKERGKSLFARKPFRRGEFIFLIAGPIVTKPTLYTVPISLDLFIDPFPVDGPAKYLCHSCDPNAGIKQRTMVVAFRDIKKGEEIRIDYAMIVDEYWDEMTPEKIICRCGSRNCRGELGQWIKLPDKIRRKYRGFVSEYLLSVK